jgi:hypothetical protein
MPVAEGLLIKTFNLILANCFYKASSLVYVLTFLFQTAKRKVTKERAF